MRRVALVLVAAAALITGTSGVAHALRDPFIVCVTEPCGPQLPRLPELPPLP